MASENKKQTDSFNAFSKQRLIYIFLSFFLIIFAFMAGVLSQAKLSIITWQDKETTCLSPDIEVHEKISAQLPFGSFLRDFEKIAGLETKSYLVVYLEKGYETSNWDFNSCPGNVLGQAYKGIYRLALYQNGKLVDEQPIPSCYRIDENKFSSLELPYRNTKVNLYPGTDKEGLEVVKLLDLKDYTGDGKPHEFLIQTTQGGCGFIDGLVAGYDERENKVILYSDWIPRFNPNSQGEFDYLFDCGDHGDLVKIERKYKFNPEKRKFEMVWEQTTPCEM